jgi:hypothetical protein
VKSEEIIIAGLLLGKRIPAATNTQAAIEKLPLLRNGAVSTPSQQLAAFPAWSVQSRYKEEFSCEGLVEFRDASLPGYELGSGWT